jgi:hypothetical protein
MRTHLAKSARAFWSVGDAGAAAENLARAGVAWAPLRNDFKICSAILDEQFWLFLSAGNASERLWRLWCVEVWPALYFWMAMKNVWWFFEKVGQKGKNLLEKWKSPKYLLVMLKSALVKLIKIKRIPIPKSPPQAPKISDVSRIWMIRLGVA